MCKTQEVLLLRRTKNEQLLKETHTAKHWLERGEPSQFANEETVKTVPVVAPSSSQWRQRGTSCSPPELFCTGHDSEIKGSDENDSERQSSDS